MQDQGKAGEPSDQQAGSCPWCGPGTMLVVRFDGMGGVALWCSACSAEGPTAIVTDSFDAAEHEAVRVWSTRPAPRSAIPGDTVRRLGEAINFSGFGLAAMLGDRHVEVRLSDLRQVVAAARSG